MGPARSAARPRRWHMTCSTSHRFKHQDHLDRCNRLSPASFASVRNEGDFVHNKTLIFAAVVPWFWACQDTTGPENAGQVTVQFEAVTTAGMSAQAAAFASSASAVPPAGVPIGGAEIDDIKLIISEIELEGSGGECLEGQDDDCEEIEVGPFLVSLLDGMGESQVNASIRPGIYDELEFELEDLEADDDDDGSKQAVMGDLLTEMRTTYGYGEFPSNASMVVHGTCPTEGSLTTELTVYFSADIEVEKEFATPFEVPGDQSILVHLDPSAWFTGMDLCALNGETVQIEGEFEFENGVQVEDDD